MMPNRPLSFFLGALALSLPLFTALTPARAGSELVVYKFKGGTTDGANPQSGLSGDSAGNGYGTTAYGGAYNDGTVYKITPTGRETILYSFAGGTHGDGEMPSAGLTLGKDGNFYGTTVYGGDGTIGYGTVYKITPAGQETVLHTFPMETMGLIPMPG